MTYRASFCRTNFHHLVIYGREWPSYCEWIVPGTITDLDRI
jgi:hypothetical protein